MINRVQSYNIIETVGVGGMGVVYKATHDFRPGYYAIKALSPQFVHDEQFRARFKQEALVLSKLNHTNIVKITDFIEDHNGIYLIMEFAEGRTLDKIIGKEVGPIPYEKALPLFTQILEGINHAHQVGVIHRDLKPSNIIVSHNGIIKITDFGIAKLEGQGLHTKTGTKMGTLYYMSPEQIKGEAVDTQSDIYSLGITLYVMLAGKLPFDVTESSSDFTIMNKIVNEELNDPRDYYPAIPEWLVNVVFKAVEKDKQKRIKNVTEFLTMLKMGNNYAQPVVNKPNKEENFGKNIRPDNIINNSEANNNRNESIEKNISLKNEEKKVSSAVAENNSKLGNIIFKVFITIWALLHVLLIIYFATK